MKPGTTWRPHQELIDAASNPHAVDSPYDKPCVGDLIVVADDGRRPVELECNVCLADVTVLQRDVGMVSTQAPTDADLGLDVE